MSGGRINTSGGISHSGRLTMSAPTATNSEPADQPMDDASDAPRCRASCGKRRSATSRVSAGVSHSDTVVSAASTMTGVASTTTNSGASHAARPPGRSTGKWPFSQPSTDQPCSAACIHATAAPHQSQPSSSASAVMASSGSSVMPMTRGRKAWASARAKASNTGFSTARSTPSFWANRSWSNQPLALV